MSDSDRAPTATAGWLRPVEAAAALGVSPEAVRARIRRGTLEARPGNDGRVRVLVTLPGRSAAATPNGHDRPPTATRPVDDATRPGGTATVGHGRDRSADDELARLRAELAEAQERAARAEGELGVELRRSADLVAERRAALARAEAVLAERDTARTEAAVLREALAREADHAGLEHARGDRLEAALAEARRPWLARVLDGLRRKGS